MLEDAAASEEGRAEACVADVTVGPPFWVAFTIRVKINLGEKSKRA